jgi:hypothetical protein
MKRYTVTYLSGALDALASLWQLAADRSVVARAADKADRILADDPTGQSQYLSEDLRKLDLWPLRFYFVVREQDRIVEVTNILLSDN